MPLGAAHVSDVLIPELRDALPDQGYIFGIDVYPYATSAEVSSHLHRRSRTDERVEDNARLETSFA